MTVSTNEIRNKFLKYYVARGHEEVPSAPIVPENDPTTLFTGSGMQPMLSYLLGSPYPSGNKRIVDSQKSFRAVDIEEVGDNRHTTFFEMLGNWSFGDYWKSEQLRWIFEFFVDELKMDPNRLYVTVFDGDKENNIPRDEESVEIWKQLFLEKGITAEVGERIFYYDAKKNWWSRNGIPNDMPVGEPGGPDSEIFYKFDIDHDPAFGQTCHPNCDCGRFLEIANSVFMEYKKVSETKFELLPQRNVDFGGGLERISASLGNDPDIFKTDVFLPAIKIIEDFTGKKYEGEHKFNMRVIADHMRGATFMLAEGIFPSNKQQGYVLRRLIRRSAVMLYFLSNNVDTKTLVDVCNGYIDYYAKTYFQDSHLKKTVSEHLELEVGKFSKLLQKGLREIEKKKDTELSSEFVFDLYQTYGFPFEITKEILSKRQVKIDEEVFKLARLKHSELSKSATKGVFKGGLGNADGKAIWYHTLTHLLHQALRDVLGSSVSQAGSNITPERLRFDFTFERALTEDEINKVEEIVNTQKNRNQAVTLETMPLEDALRANALAFFKEKYSPVVNVYSVGDYSKEVCGGPHVNNTSEIKGKFVIQKEQSLGSGIRRIRAIIE